MTILRLNRLLIHFLFDQSPPGMHHNRENTNHKFTKSGLKLASIQDILKLNMPYSFNEVSMNHLNTAMSSDIIVVRCACTSETQIVQYDLCNWFSTKRLLGASRLHLVENHLIFTTFLFELLDRLEVEPLFLHKIQMLVVQRVSPHLLVLLLLLNLHTI